MAGRTLSNVDIENYYKGNPHWGGVHMRDEFATMKLEDKFYIANLDDSTGPGTHWTLIFNVPIPDDNPDLTIYADSYGVYPPNDVLAFLRQSHRPMVYTSDQYQSLDSTACGWFCCYIADQLLLSVKYEKLFDGTLREHQYAKNEKAVTHKALQKALR